MPAKFRRFAGATSDAWLPIDDAAASDVAAGLRPGLSIAQAQRQLNEAVAPSSSSGRKPEFWIRPADWRRIDPPPGATTLSHVMLRGLVAAALLVLIIACANVSNLLTERTVAREHEIATRLAIGASRAQVARLLMMEAVVISLLGGGVALVAASWIVEALPGLMPPGLAAGLLEFLMPTTGWRLWAFATATAICTGVLFGTIPALRVGDPAGRCPARGSGCRHPHQGHSGPAVWDLAA